MRKMNLGVLPDPHAARRRLTTLTLSTIVVVALLGLVSNFSTSDGDDISLSSLEYGLRRGFSPSSFVSNDAKAFSAASFLSESLRDSSTSAFKNNWFVWQAAKDRQRIMFVSKRLCQLLQVRQLLLAVRYRRNGLYARLCKLKLCKTETCHMVCKMRDTWGALVILRT